MSYVVVFYGGLKSALAQKTKYIIHSVIQIWCIGFIKTFRHQEN